MTLSLNASAAEVRRLRAGEPIAVSIPLDPQPSATCHVSGQEAHARGTGEWLFFDGCERVVAVLPPRPGDVIDVREPWFDISSDGDPPHLMRRGDSQIVDKAVGERWQPASTMPRHLIRLRALVTDASPARPVLVEGVWVFEAVSVRLHNAAVAAEMERS